MTRCPNPACTWNDGGPCVRAASIMPGAVCPDLGGPPFRDNAGAATSPEAATSTVATAKGSPPADKPYDGRFWVGSALGLEELWHALWGPDRKSVV